METPCSSLLLGLEFNMPSQAQVLLLAAAFGQVEYQKFAGKEKVSIAKLQLCYSKYASRRKHSFTYSRTAHLPLNVGIQYVPKGPKICLFWNQLLI
jgi:hypothetical protein